jgi:hypothetical protein
MTICIEDPDKALAEVSTGKKTWVCPHGFPATISCECYLRQGHAPEVGGCKGRLFAEHSVDTIIPLVSARASN